jgi:hypothetical protein
MAISGVARRQGRRLAAAFYPFGHPTPYAHALRSKILEDFHTLDLQARGSDKMRQVRRKSWCNSRSRFSVDKRFLKEKENQKKVKLTTFVRLCSNSVEGLI